MILIIVGGKILGSNTRKSTNLLQLEVECINERVLSMIPGDTREYLSSDSSYRSEFRSGGNRELVSVDFLNSIKLMLWTPESPFGA
ncbi:hypothetical protein ACS0TY_019584 [Phlomoides rotata]